MNLEERLNSIDNLKVAKNAPMNEQTSFRAGGCADFLVEPADEAALKEVLQVLHGTDVPYMVLGNGSNVLVRDGGYHGVIIKIGEAFDYVRQEEQNLLCGAGTLMSVVARAATAASLAGFEFASGIPGSIGGAVFMNAGAYDGEIKNILSRVRVITKDGTQEKWLTPEDLDMGYRHTALHETGDVVVQVELKLQPGNQEEIREKIADFTNRRNTKQPVAYPSAGSFFKRPEGYFAGKLIQDAGCKGLTVGGAQVSELHAGFVINIGNATATDIVQLKELVQGRVYEKFGVMLEPEVRIIGED